MQIKETTNKGLKRAYQLTIPAKDIAAKIEAEVKKIAPQVQMPGFRAYGPAYRRGRYPRPPV